MNQNELAIEANKHINSWAQGVDKLVVAIDGYVGVGKTTLSDNLVKINLEILPVHYDDFLISTKELKERLRMAGTDQREEVPHHRYEEMGKLIQSFREGKNYQTKVFNAQTGEVDQSLSYVGSKKILVIDGVFMFDPKRLNHLWDRRIYLTGDLQKIDERRVKREKERWGEKYFPETHPDSHFRQVTEALKKYQKEFEPEKLADLVLKVD